MLVKRLTALDAEQLRATIGPYRKRVAFVVVLSLLELVLLTFGVGLVYPIVAIVLGGPEAIGSGKEGGVFTRYFPADTNILLAFSLVVAIFAGKSALGLWRAWATRTLSEQLRGDWSEIAADRLYRQTLSVHHALRDGVKVGTIVREPKLAANCIGGSINYFVNLLSIAVMMALAIYASWQATLAIAVVGGGLALVVRATLMKRIQLLGHMRLITNHMFNSEVVETVSAIKDVKALGLEDYMRHRMDVQSRELARVTVLSNFFSQVPNVLTDLIAITVFLSFVYALLQFYEGNVTSLLPQLALFFAVLVKLFSSGGQVIAARATILANLASLDQIVGILKGAAGNDDLERSDGGLPIKRFETDIALRQVTFGYDPQQLVLRDVSLTFPRGQVTYVMGPSGIGKTTLVDLLLRYYEPQSGSVEVNGHDIRDYNLKAWRRRIGYVGQDALLFSGTIRENIALGEPAATEEKIRWAAEIAGASDFIGELAEGYDTVVGEKGVTLSGGQRMRIAIARAAIRAPDLVIIDEGTARFELSLEQQMVEALRSLPGWPTVIIITHRHQSTDFGDNVIDFSAVRGGGSTGPGASKPAALSGAGAARGGN